MNIITLTTDFGAKDYYVALLKGHILRAVPKAMIVDITHDIEAHDVMEGAFFLKSVYKSYPIGTIHIVGVNTYYTAQSKLIIFHHEDYTFIGPNNGLFSLVLENIDESKIIEIADQDILDLYEVIENSVQGVSVNCPLDKLGFPTKEFVKKLSLQPVINRNHIRATIIYIDHFGNVIVNLNKKSFEEVRDSRSFAIYYKREEPIVELSDRYNNVQVGDVCAFFNSIDMLELAVNMGNAHELLTLNKNETIQIDFF